MAQIITGADAQGTEFVQGVVNEGPGKRFEAAILVPTGRDKCSRGRFLAFDLKPQILDMGGMIVFHRQTQG